MSVRIWVGLLLLICPVVVSAQSEEFTIKVFGSEDLEAPSTPVILSAIPLTFDQIDLQWSTSTDNFTVFGYVVYRDGVSIATTTLTTYSDSGLSASTTYSYEVIAFDNVPNYSTSSVAIATTTPPAPIIATPPFNTPPVSTVARVVLDSVDVSVGVAAASINVQVRQPARIEVRLGETTEYEKGYFAGSVYRLGHTVPINDLRANTTYYYELIGYTPFGIQTVLQQGSFTTRNDVPPASPANVVNFAVMVAGSAAVANWDLPDGFSGDTRVRIVRSHLGFPTALDDGAVVYEGRGQVVRDPDAFALSDIAYYTAFVIDPSGLVSSGAVALVRMTRDTDLPGDLEDSSLGNNGEPVIIEVGSTTSNQVPMDPNMPNRQDIVVSQGGVTYSFSSTTIPLDSTEHFYVSIPANKIAGEFKTIVATLDDPRGSGKNFSFLLRLNNDRTEYTATIAPVQAEGNAQLLVDVYDYSAKVVGSYQTQLVFTTARGTSSSTFEVLMWRLQTFAWGLLLCTPLVTLAGVWFIFRRRHVQDEDNKPSV